MSSFEYKRQLTTIAACFLVYSLSPAPGPLRHIPADLRDAPNSGSALKDLDAARG